MPGPQFFETRMGHISYEGHVPRLVKALESIAASPAILAAQATAKPACVHDWQEQPGEPPRDVCSSCGLIRE